MQQGVGADEHEPDREAGEQQPRQRRRRRADSSTSPPSSAPAPMPTLKPVVYQADACCSIRSGAACSCRVCSSAGSAPSANAHTITAAIVQHDLLREAEHEHRQQPERHHRERRRGRAPAEPQRDRDDRERCRRRRRRAARPRATTPARRRDRRGTARRRCRARSGRASRPSSTGSTSATPRRLLPGSGSGSAIEPVDVVATSRRWSTAGSSRHTATRDHEADDAEERERPAPSDQLARAASRAAGRARRRTSRRSR